MRFSYIKRRNSSFESLALAAKLGRTGLFAIFWK
jgi:hypothetical protein